MGPCVGQKEGRRAVAADCDSCEPATCATWCRRPAIKRRISIRKSKKRPGFHVWRTFSLVPSASLSVTFRGVSALPVSAGLRAIARLAHRESRLKKKAPKRLPDWHREVGERRVPRPRAETLRG